MKSLAIIFTIAATIFTSSAFAKSYNDGDVLPCGKIYNKGTTIISANNKAFYPAGMTFKQVAESSAPTVNKRQ